MGRTLIYGLPEINVVGVGTQTTTINTDSVNSMTVNPIYLDTTSFDNNHAWFHQIHNVHRTSEQTTDTTSTFVNTCGSDGGRTLNFSPSGTVTTSNLLTTDGEVFWRDSGDDSGGGLYDGYAKNDSGYTSYSSGARKADRATKMGGYAKTGQAPPIKLDLSLFLAQFSERRIDVGSPSS
jgi:hypothetical protein